MSNQKKMINIDKRKAIYVIEEDDEGIFVSEKRPKIRDQDEFRPFWTNFNDADAIIDKIVAGRKVTLYRIKNNKIESYRVRKLESSPHAYTSREQAKEKLDTVLETLDYTITRGIISVFYRSKTYNVTASDKRFPMLRKACISDDVAGILQILNLAAELKSAKIEAHGSKLAIANTEMPDGFAKKVKDQIVIGDKKSIAAFAKRLEKNASRSARENLLKFLSYHGGCLLSDGRFLAYKYVKSDFRDYHTGQYDYSPGKTITMPRKNVVEDARVACAAGLHVGTWGYSGSSKDTVLVCCIDPADVVSVPDDYGHQKIRACKVLSLKLVTGPFSETVMPASFVDEALKEVAA